nr:VanZ family protein [Neobacillus sp. Marseille-Q6967]
MKILNKSVLFLILCLYLAILTKLILFKYIPLSEIHQFNFTSNQYFWRSNNFVPFKTIYFYLFLADLNTGIKIENLVGNVIGFAPFGFILPLLSKKFLNLKSITLATLSLSLTFEVLQLVFEFGSFDVDDLILNTLGGILGYIPIRVYYFFKRPKKKRK